MRDIHLRSPGWCGDGWGRGEEGQVGVRRGVTTYWGWGGGGREGWERVPSGVKIPLFHMGFTHSVNGAIDRKFEARNLKIDVFLFIYKILRHEKLRFARMIQILHLIYAVQDLL